MASVENILKEALRTQSELLDLSYLQLSEIPESVFEMKHLKGLYLRGNQIQFIPNEVQQLTQLQDLDVSQNRIERLPTPLFRLAQLQILEISHNRIQELPILIGQLKQLKKIFLSHNQIMVLPDAVTQLPQLEALFVDHNRLKRLPTGLGNLKTLTRLLVQGNPLDSPPIEIVEKGTEMIKNYLQELETQGVDFLYECKLLILGEGGAGKTTLASKIQNPDYVLQDEDTTRGIEVLEWYSDIVAPNGTVQPFRINIWDFGGQEIYHATHQFFLTKRSVYALVSDTRKEDTDFHYWLNAIDILSGGSPAVVVLNEKQDRQKILNQLKLRQDFTNLKQIKTVNFATNRGLKSLVHELTTHLQALPHIGAELPKTWITLRKRLEIEERPYITDTEYLRICKLSGIPSRQKAMELSEYFHDLGVFLHFQADKLLKKIIFLKPKWTTQAVYRLIDTPQIVQQHGFFTTTLLETVWHEEDYWNIYDELIELMKKFEICYELREKNTFIIPQLLACEMPVYEWDKFNSLCVKYVYQFLPKGIITRLIVRLHWYIAGQDCVWREGMLLSRDGAKAEVIEHYHQRMITIRVTGRDRKELLTIITEYLDEINNMYHKKLVVNKQIPCNCSRCKIHPEPYFYKLDRLKRRVNDGQSTVECDESYEQVPVLNLIDDISVLNLPMKDVKKMVVGGKIEKAMEDLLEKVQDSEVENEILMILGRYRRYQQAEYRNVQPRETLNIELAAIQVAALTIIDNQKND